MTATFANLPCREEEPIARHLPLRAAEGTFERWIEVPDETTLVAVIRAARAEKLPIRPVPPFHDALPTEGGLTGIALRLGRDFEKIREVQDGFEIGAAVPLALLSLLPGFSPFSRAPGTLSDALEEGWIAPWVVRLRRYKGRGFEDVADPTPDPKALVVAAVLKAGPKLAIPQAGSAFLEPKGRASLRTILGRAKLAGLRVHGAGLAEEDAAVLVNRGEASARQLRVLVGVVRERVQNMTGIVLVERLEAPGRGGRL